MSKEAVGIRTDGLYVRHTQGDAALLVNRDWCKGCSICVEACPKSILALDDGERVIVTDMEQCIFCGVCAVRCPDFCFILDRGSRLNGSTTEGLPCD